MQQPPTRACDLKQPPQRGYSTCYTRGVKRDFISMFDVDRDELLRLLDDAARLKADWQAGIRPTPLLGKTIAMLFEKPSLRTRLSFEIGMLQLGGAARFMGPTEVGLGKRESVADVARTLGLFVDGVVVRTFGHDVAEELARHCPVPVISGLSDDEHPCQILADLLTLRETFGRLEGLTVAYVGDSNNVAHSLLIAAPLVGLKLCIASPEGFEPRAEVLARAVESAGGDAWVEICRDPKTAVENADAVYADSWYSMGQEREADTRRKIFRPYQVNRELLSYAKPGVFAMHCMPAHRGDEITDEVLDGPESLALRQAENRLHAQKALLVWLLAERDGSALFPDRSS
jgi:ornithine carbamoyltransferase